ncbi:hypothetical protein RI367_007411 [Sorochytrium milnesiophthora]
MSFYLADVPAQDSLVGSQDVIALFGLQGMYNQHFRPYIPATAAPGSASSTMTPRVPVMEPLLKTQVKGLPGILDFAKQDESLLKIAHKAPGSSGDEAPVVLPLDRIQGRFTMRPGEVYNVLPSYNPYQVYSHEFEQGGKRSSMSGTKQKTKRDDEDDLYRMAKRAKKK